MIIPAVSPLCCISLYLQIPDPFAIFLITRLFCASHFSAIKALIEDRHILLCILEGQLRTEIKVYVLHRI